MEEMFTWKEEVSIATLHRAYTDGKINIPQLGRMVAKRLQNLELYKNKDQELVDIITEFESLHEVSTYGDYSAVLEMLVDFGNKDRRLWIESSMVKPGEKIEEEIPKCGSLEDYGDSYGPAGMWPSMGVGAEVYDGIWDDEDVAPPKKPTKVDPNSSFLTFSELELLCLERRKDLKVVPTRLHYHIQQAKPQYRDWLIEHIPNFKEHEVPMFDEKEKVNVQN